MAGAPPAHATHDRKPGTLDELADAAGEDEPAPVAGVAALPGVGRRPPGRRRLALEDRPDDALRRLRPVAAGVDDAQPARAADAVPRHPRQAARGDGLGHGTRSRCSRTCRRTGAARSSTTSATSSTSSSPTWCRSWCSIVVRQERADGPHDAPRPQPGQARPAPPPRAARARPLLLLHGLGERRRRPCRRGSSVEGTDRRARLHRSRAVDDPGRRRLHVRDPPRRRRHRPRRAGRGDGVRARPRRVRRADARRRPARPRVRARSSPTDRGSPAAPTFPTSQSFFALPRRTGSARSRTRSSS